MLKIAILALENCFHSSVIGAYDIFSEANRNSLKLCSEKRPFCQIYIVKADTAQVRTSSGLVIESQDTVLKDRQYDIVIVPALFGKVKEALKRRDIINWIVEQQRNGACICTVCAGAFLAAEAGLLEGRRATTHWALADEFEKTFPGVILQAEKMLVDEGEVISAGGVTAYQDLCLYLVNRFGSHELASILSRSLLIDATRQAQLPYSSHVFTKDHGDDAVMKCQKWIEKNINRRISLREAAKEAGLGERTFARRFKRATGDSLSGYIQLLRVEMARKLLTTSRQSFDEITYAVGYEDSSSFRRLFKNHTDLSPSNYRKRFSLLVPLAL